MRLLVACPACRQQYDASNRAAGSRFHCLCGEILTVPAPTFLDASVVRCSSCGAPREAQSAACRFCGADFTLHERDLHTICPGCMARVSDRAKFCHHCATPLLSVLSTGEETSFACPACRDGGRTLSSRSLGQPAVAVLECPACAGLWLGRETFELLVERARALAPPPSLAADLRVVKGAAGRKLGPGEPIYRACPLCGQLMHRQNYGRKSGIIIDSCRPHGIWFDASELDALLRWVKRGGEVQSHRLAREEEQQLERQVRLRKTLDSADPGWDASYGSSKGFLDLIGWLVNSF